MDTMFEGTIDCVQLDGTEKIADAGNQAVKDDTTQPQLCRNRRSHKRVEVVEQTLGVILLFQHPQPRKFRRAIDLLRLLVATRVVGKYIASRVSARCHQTGAHLRGERVDGVGLIRSDIARQVKREEAVGYSFAPSICCRVIVDTRRYAQAKFLDNPVGIIDCGVRKEEVDVLGECVHQCRYSEIVELKPPHVRPNTLSLSEYITAEVCHTH